MHHYYCYCYLLLPFATTKSLLTIEVPCRLIPAITERYHGVTMAAADAAFRVPVDGRMKPHERASERKNVAIVTSRRETTLRA